MSKKLLKRFIAMVLVGAMITSISVHAQVHEVVAADIQHESIDKSTVAFSSYDDPVLYDMIQTYGLTQEEVNKIDELIDKELAKPQTRAGVTTVAAVVGIVVGVVGLMGATYNAGRYAARQCEVRLGLTKSMYRANRWGYRLALSNLVFAGGVAGATVALGFDDYYMGV